MVRRSPSDLALSALGTLVAARPVFRALRGAGWAVEGGGRVAAAAREAFARQSRPILPADLPSDPAERWEEMRRMHGVTEADVEGRRRAARASFLAYLLAAMAMVAWAVASPRLGLAPHVTGVLPWLVALVLALKALGWSHVHHHLRHRRLTPFRAWIRDSANVMAPVFDTGGAGRTAVRLLAMLAGLAALHPAMAAAQAAVTPGDTGSLAGVLTGSLPPGDLSLQWMQRLFPSQFAVTGVGVGQDAIAQMLGVVNTMLMAACCAMVAWEAVSGMVHAAHNGRAFSDRYHALWAPVRVVVGVGAVVPVSGYCLAQVLMIMVGLGGYKLANATWTGYLQLATGMTEAAGPGLSGEGRWAVAPGGGAVSVPPDVVAQLPGLLAVLNAETCWQSLRWASRGPGQTQNPPAQPSIGAPAGLFASRRPMAAHAASPGVDVPGGKVWDWGQACGSVTWTVRPGSTGSVAALLAANRGTGVVVPDESRVAEREDYLRTFDRERADAFGTLVKAVQDSGVAEAAASLSSPGFMPPDGGTPDVVGKMQAVLQAYSAYKGALLASSSRLSAGLNKATRAALMDRSATMGWAAAGAVQPALARANRTVVDRVMEDPSIETANMEMGAVGGEARAIYGRSQAQLSAVLYSALPNSTPSQRVAGGLQGFPEIDVARDLRTNPETSITVWLGRVSERVFILFEGGMRLNPLDPLSDIQNTGQAMEAVLTRGWGTWTLINVAAKVADKVSQGVSSSFLGWFGGGVVSGGIAGAIEGAVRAVAPFVTSFFWWMLGLAALWSTVIPMLGYVFWMFGVAGIVVFQLEAVVGAAFWAFSHVRTDGSGDFVGQAQRHGYQIGFNLLFRPMLMVVGLVAGHVVFAVMASFVNATFALAAGAAFSGESFYGSRIMSPVSMIVLLGTLLYLHYQVGVRSYSLITQLPDRVARWSGASGENLGEEGHAEGSHQTIVMGVRNQAQAVNAASRGVRADRDTRDFEKRPEGTARRGALPPEESTPRPTGPTRSTGYGE